MKWFELFATEVVSKWYAHKGIEKENLFRDAVNKLFFDTVISSRADLISKEFVRNLLDRQVYYSIMNLEVLLR